MATQSVKDILDAGIPSPTYVISPTVSNGLREGITFTRPGAARTLGPRTSTYRSVGADKARIYGAEQELLVETAPRTNYVPDSSKFSNWGNASALGATDTKPSILEGESASRVVGDGSFSALRRVAGSYSSGQETLSVILEKDSVSPASNFAARTVDRNNFNTHGSLKLDTSSGDFVLQDGLEANKQILTRNGPNGGTVWLVEVQYNPSNDGVSGTGRRVDIFPDQNNSEAVYLHHAQVEQNVSSSSPIVTGSSSASRNKDSLSFSAGDWWNEREGTFFLEIRPTTFDVKNKFGNPIVGILAGAASWMRMGGNAPFNLVSAGADIELPGVLPAYEKSRIAVTFSSSGRAAIAANGDYEETNSGGESLTSKGNIEIGGFSALVASFGTIRYIPQALPTSRSDRSAGDPISLETLTA